MQDVDITSLLPRLLALSDQGRRLIAIAGPPGSGKSTLAARLAKALNATRPGVAAVVPMDGFHLDDAVLRAQGTLARKGAPWTFDTGGLLALLDRLRRNAENQIAIPLFDRNLEIARAGAALVAQDVPLLLVEGNYLLLDHPPWDAMAAVFDLTIFLDVPPATLERRLIDRWLAHGMTPDAARLKAQGNDLPNARMVIDHSRPADIRLHQQ